VFFRDNRIYSDFYKLFANVMWFIVTFIAHNQ